MRRALVAGALLCFLGAAWPGLQRSATADTQPGSGFFGYTLTASAQGVQITEDEPSANSHPEAEAEVPQSQVSLTAGPVGYALSSLAWPGALAGNAGSLLLLAAGSSAPPQLIAANDPLRAEARSGSASPDTTNDDVPGSQLQASAHLGQVTADARLDGGSVGGTVGFGTTTSGSKAILTANTASTTADSTIKDLSLAGGAIHIGAVLSHAEATSNGVTAAASGTTTVLGMTVAGIPVTVDDKGITVAAQHSAPNPAAATTVNNAIAALHLTVALSTPSHSRTGGTVSYDAGSLFLDWQPPGSSNTFTATLGGARVVASATPADNSAGGLPPKQDAIAPTDQLPRAIPATAGATVMAPTGALPTAPAGAALPSPTLATSVPLTLSAALLGGEVTATWTRIAAVLGALLLLGGLWRVPTLVLVDPASHRCPLKENP